MMNDERKNIIRELQLLAEDVYKLKQERRQKRPIVIEFCGSPKAGKTTCINSLELFLKRNGFSVKIIHERASLCPVTDKQSPMFNTWTVSTSLAGMIGVLMDKNSHADVLILDRGIFDSLCWFQWLADTGKMETLQYNTTVSYYLMNEFVKYIDIVFAFCVKPEVSIQREYAHLLTDKQGSIMNRCVLQEYLNALDIVEKQRGSYFHEIFKIDTSSKSQNDVGKEVTEKTLNTLKTALMERIGYISATSDLIREFKKTSTCIIDINNTDVEYPDVKFDLREKVEENREFVQPVPIALITNIDESKILTIKKKNNAVSNDSPEKEHLLPYVGGHARIEDCNQANINDYIGICREALKREVFEEIGISIAVEDVIPICIYTPDNPKSEKHLAVCFKVSVDEDTINLRIDNTELVMNKGTSSSGRFQRIDDLPLEKMEKWGLSILQHYFGIKTETSEQITMQDYYQRECEIY